MMNKAKKLLTITLLSVSMAASAAGCGNKSDDTQSEAGTQTSASIAEIHEAVRAAYGEDYYPNMSYDETAIQELFGITPDMVDEIIAEGPMISASVDTFIAVKAKQGQGGGVFKALNTYRDSLLKDTLQYPSNLVKIQASVVEQRGDYVFFLMLGNIPMEAEEQGEEAILKAAQEQNQIGQKAISEFFE